MKKSKRNFDTVTFKGKEYGKSPLVLAVIKEYIRLNPKMTFEELSKKINFNKDGAQVYKGYDIIVKCTDKRAKNSKKGHKRYNHKNILKSSDNINFIVTNQWGIDNIDKQFIYPIATEQLNFRIPNFSRILTRKILLDIAKVKGIYGNIALDIAKHKNFKEKEAISFMNEISEQAAVALKSTTKLFGETLLVDINTHLQS